MCIVFKLILPPTDIYSRNFAYFTISNTVTRDKKIDWQKRQTSRNVFQCNVIGCRGAGKTNFSQGLVERSLDHPLLHPEHLSTYTINTVQVYGQERYLLVRFVLLLFFCAPSRSGGMWISYNVLIHLNFDHHY